MQIVLEEINMFCENFIDPLVCLKVAVGKDRFYWDNVVSWMKMEF